MYVTNDRSDLILSLVDKKDSIDVVTDLGSNDGATLLGLYYNDSIGATKYHGVDCFIPVSNDSNVSFHICDLNGKLLEIQDILETSDLILLLDVLEHLHEPEEFLDRLSQTIKLGSQLVITVPNASSLRMLYAWLKRDFPREKIGYFDQTHRSWFTVKSLLRIITPKFHYKKVGYIYSKNLIIRLLQKLIPARLSSQFFVLLTVK